MNRRAPYPDNSAEMLELIAKVTASISDRMNAQDHAIEEIRLLGREANAQIIDRMPHTVQDMDGMRRKVSESTMAAAHAEQASKTAEYHAGQIQQRFQKARAESEEYRMSYLKERHRLKMVACLALVAVPLLAVLMAIELPTFFGHNLVTCGVMEGTWHIENGRAYCYFVKLAD